MYLTHRVTWTHPRVLRYPHQEGLQTPDMVALVATVAQNDLAGAISAAAHSAMEIGAPVESIYGMTVPRATSSQRMLSFNFSENIKMRG